MLFNVLCLFLIVAITLYLATQGMLSSLLALTTATFSSILAMALMEPLHGLMAGYRPAFARGATLLLVFLLAFSATRIIADLLVPKNIKVPPLVNRLAGGFLGFFTALVVIGTVILGVDMLPLPTSLLGYDRFPAESRMKSDTPGLTVAPASTWLAPERFTLALWNGASGRGLGGARPFADVHPDLSVESYGYRNSVYYASQHALPADLFQVKAAWMSADPKDFDALGIRPVEPGRKVVMVRTAVKKGSKPELESADVGGDSPFFRITPTQVRLVTDKGRQYYPAGYLETGRTFVPLPLDTGHLVEDFQGGVVNNDWVFQIADDEKPTFIEMKQLARADIGGQLKEKPVAALAAREYPQKTYQKEGSTLDVAVSLPSPILEGQVFVLRPSVKASDVQSQVRAGYDHAVEVTSGVNSGSGSWTRDGRPGVPPASAFSSVLPIGQQVLNAPTGEPAEWGRVLPLIILKPIGVDAGENPRQLANYVNDTIVPMFQKVSGGTAIVTSAKLNADGTATLDRIPKGKQTVFVTARIEKGFYYWIKDISFTARSANTLPLDAAAASSPKIELP